MLGQFEDDYWGAGGEWQGPTQFVDYGPPAPEISEPTIPDLPSFDYPSIDFGGGGIDWGMPSVPEYVDPFSGMFDNIQPPTFEQWDVFNEPAGEDQSVLGKIWEGIKEFGKGLTFGGGGGSTAGGTVPVAPGMPNYPNYGQSPSSGIGIGTVALLGAGAMVLFAMTKGKR